MKSITEQLRGEIAKAEKRGRTRYSIAKAAGIAPIVLSRIADGQRSMKLETAEKIAEALELSLRLVTKRLICEQDK